MNLNSPIIPLLPHMEREGIDLLKESLQKTKVYLEYGSGGSTLFAAECGVSKIHSIDSDLHFLQAVQQKAQELYPKIDLNIYYANIGLTKEWGYPVDHSLMKNWPNYCITAWKEILTSSELPDLILIDGRFRVASFLASLIFSKLGTIILFDDYYDRSHYHLVEKHLKVTKKAGRMAEFIVDTSFSKQQVILDLMPYSTDPS
ncbi:MAG: hypothetical protein ACOYK6_02990 [Chthoniobacterales bacterium]